LDKKNENTYNPLGIKLQNPFYINNAQGKTNGKEEGKKALERGIRLHCFFYEISIM